MRCSWLEDSQPLGVHKPVKIILFDLVHLILKIFYKKRPLPAQNYTVGEYFTLNKLGHKIILTSFENIELHHCLFVICSVSSHC